MLIRHRSSSASHVWQVVIADYKSLRTGLVFLASWQYQSAFADHLPIHCSKEYIQLARWYLGGGAQRSARTGSGSKPKPAKPPVRMESLPPPAAKLLNVAPAALLPHSPSVAMDPAAMLGAHSSHTASAAAAIPAAAVSTSPAALALASASAQFQKSDVAMADRANLVQMDTENGTDLKVANGQPSQNPSRGADNQSHGGDSCSPGGLPQLGLTVSPSRVASDPDRPLARSHSKASSRNGRSGSLSKGNTPRASIGRPPRSGSGTVHRQDSVASDKKDSRKLLRRNTTG